MNLKEKILESYLSKKICGLLKGREFLEEPQNNSQEVSA